VTNGAAVGAGWTGGRNPWAIALVVSMATFMEVLDTAIANVSLPHIAGDLSVTQDEGTWVLTSYLIANAVVVPISGWLATRFGRKRFYMACVALFVASSLLCGMAPSLEWLVLFRVLQGIGGGGLAPCEQAILIDTFPPGRRAGAMALYSMTVVMAPAIGPTLGGLITEHLSWRWVFFINIPIGLLSLLLTSRMVSDPPHLRRTRGTGRGVDYVGLGLISLGLACLQFVLDRGQQEDWLHSPAIVVGCLLAGGCLVAFVVWEWHAEHPIIDVRMFCDRTFAAASALMLVTGFLLFAPLVLLPAFEQYLMGYSPQQAGQTMSPGAMSLMLLTPLVGALVARVDARKLVAVGALLLAGAHVYMASRLHVGVDFQTLLVLRIFQVAGLAFLFVPINTLVYASVPREKNNAVAAILNLGRNLGGSIGIAFVTTMIARQSQVHQTALVSHATNYDAPFTAQLARLTSALEQGGASTIEAGRRALALTYQEIQRQAAQLAYLDTLRLLAVAALVMLPLLLLARSPLVRSAD
jgi:MFS transporter, DHA2 family, multidrug resistance protein